MDQISQNQENSQDNNLENNQNHHQKIKLKNNLFWKFILRPET